MNVEEELPLVVKGPCCNRRYSAQVVPRLSLLPSQEFYDDWGQRSAPPTMGGYKKTIRDPSGNIYEPGDDSVFEHPPAYSTVDDDSTFYTAFSSQTQSTRSNIPSVSTYGAGTESYPGSTSDELTSDGKPWSFYANNYLKLGSTFKDPAYMSRDPFLKADKVMGLSGSTFHEFLDNIDLAMVMFYDSSTYAKWDIQHRTKTQVEQASEKTKRENHVFAALDCFKNKRFCSEEGVRYFPTVRIYKKGKCLGMVHNLYIAAESQLRELLEAAAKP